MSENTLGVNLPAPAAGNAVALRETAFSGTPPAAAGPDAGVYAELGRLPPGAIVSESGLAQIFGRECRETVKRAVDRGELPPPVKFMGQNCWTAGRLVAWFEKRLDAEERKYSRLRA